MTPSQRLLQRARPIWAQCLSHPFVMGIGDGSLAPERFRYFLLQDYLYLVEYARVFALGAAKGESLEEMAGFSAGMYHILNQEMTLHRDYMARLGISPEEVAAAKPARANLSYTSYMLAAAHGGGTAEVLAAILACSWSYADIGLALAQRAGALEHPRYGQWVAGYAAQEYQAENARLIRDFDRRTQDVGTQTLARLEEIFLRCSQYELDFWEMAWRMEQ